MSEDRPLTEFAADDADADDNDDEAIDSDDTDEPTADDAADSPVDADTEPATATYRWQPDGATCGDCGATTERQWRDDERFVCPDCKSW
jgi:hypothetical protein